MIRLFVLFLPLLMPAYVYCTDVDDQPVKISESETHYIINNCNQIIDLNAHVKCLEDEYTRVDTLLNHNYSIMLRTLEQIDRDEEGRNALDKMVQAQRAWLKYRDRDVAFVQNGESPRTDRDPDKQSADVFIINAHKYAEAEKWLSMIVATYQRANLLYAYLKCEGAFSRFCPVALG